MNRHITERCHINILQSQQNLATQQTNITSIKQVKKDTFMLSKEAVECYSDIIYSLRTEEEKILKLFYYDSLDILVTLELRDQKLPFIWFYKHFKQSKHEERHKNINMKPSIENLQLSENCCGFGLNELNTDSILMSQVNNLLFVKTDKIYCLELKQDDIQVLYSFTTEIDEEMKVLEVFYVEEEQYCIFGTDKNIYLSQISRKKQKITEFVLLEEAEKAKNNDIISIVIIKQRDVQHNFAQFSNPDVSLSLLGILYSKQSYCFNFSILENRAVVYISSRQYLRIIELGLDGIYDYGLFELFKTSSIINVFVTRDYFFVQTNQDGIFLYFYLIPDNSLIKADTPYTKVLRESSLYRSDEIVNCYSEQYIERCKTMQIQPAFDVSAVQASLKKYLDQLSLVHLFAYNLTPEECNSSLFISSNYQSNQFSYVLTLDDAMIAKQIQIQPLRDTILQLNDYVQSVEQMEDAPSELIDAKIYALGQMVMYGLLIRENQRIGNATQFFIRITEASIVLTKSDRECSYLLCQLNMSNFGSFPEISSSEEQSLKLPLNVLAQYLAVAPAKLGILLSLHSKPIYEALGLRSPLDFENFDSILELFCQNDYHMKRAGELDCKNINFAMAKQLIESNLVSIYAGNLGQQNREFQAIQSLYICINYLIRTALLYGQARIRIRGDVLTTLSLIDSFLNCAFEECLNLVFFELCNHLTTDMREFVTEVTVGKLREALATLMQKASKYRSEVQARAAYINICLSIAIETIDSSKAADFQNTEGIIEKNLLQMIEIVEENLISAIGKATNSMYLTILKFFCQQFESLVVQSVALDIKHLSADLSQYCEKYYGEDCLRIIIVNALIQLNNENFNVPGLKQELLLAVSRVEGELNDIVDRSLALRNETLREEFAKLKLNYAEEFIMNQFVDNQQEFEGIYQEFTIMNGYIQKYFAFMKEKTVENLLQLWKVNKYLTSLVLAKKLDEPLCLELLGYDSAEKIFIYQMINSICGIEDPIAKYIQ